jgi:hypothetical protein
LWAGQIGRAQEFKVWDRTVQVHGFASQGFVYTDENNWLTMNTSQGSGAMTDMGLTVSSQLTDKFRVGAQVYDRNLGELGRWHPSLDWAVADYRFNNWLGIRAGKVKTTLGLYNDSQDLDSLHVFAPLPQSVYPTDLRDTMIAHAGGDLYGNVPLRHHLGDLAYTAYVGHRSDSIYSGYPYLVTNSQVYFRSMGGLQYGGDLRWNTPVTGLMIGASRMNEEITGKGTFVNPLNPSAGLVPYEISSTSYWTNGYYGEYIAHGLRIDAEYRRHFSRQPYVAGTEVEIDTRAWYVSGAYRIRKHIEVGSYYSHYTVTNVVGGPLGSLFPSQTETDLPQNHVYDKVAAARIDLNRYTYVKLEGHFINGYGVGTYPDGFYPQQNPQGFRTNTNALVIKTGFHF